MARSGKNSQDAAFMDATSALLALKHSSGIKHLNTLCGVFLVFSLVAAGFLVSSRSPGEVFLPVLGTNLFNGNSELHLQEQLVSNDGGFWESEAADHVYIQDVVALPEEVLLLFRTRAPYHIQQPEQLTCLFANKTVARVHGIDRQYQRWAIRCGLSSNQVGSRALVSLNNTDGLIVHPTTEMEVFRWDSVAFEALLTPEDVVLFAKGIVTRRGHERHVKDLKCLFDDQITTRVTNAAQEVFRCEHPPRQLRRSLAGKKVTLRVNGTSMPSVAYYEHWKQGAPTTKYYICSCTMVFNIAKFLKEWVTYHAMLGVERFFFYDNNSEDNLIDVLEELKQYNVSRHFWPWTKTQEAGFSHCALRARSECTWMAFIDVDEFIFPRAWLRNDRLQPLRKLVQELSNSGKRRRTHNRGGFPGLWNPWQATARRRNVGQIFFGCRVFGPSGLGKHPAAGVTQGYICRTRKLQRHKSIVLLDAVDTSLLNVVHHFKLRPGYTNATVSSLRGYIHHYKYQAWEEFRSKFRRRVSAYVADWKQDKNLDSKDRTPGLGTREVEPGNWTRKFCEVNDTALRDYVLKAFSGKDKKRLVWQ